VLWVSQGTADADPAHGGRISAIQFVAIDKILILSHDKNPLEKLLGFWSDLSHWWKCLGLVGASRTLVFISIANCIQHAGIRKPNSRTFLIEECSYSLGSAMYFAFYLRSFQARLNIPFAYCSEINTMLARPIFRALALC
jgi:hypothetical protein